MSIGNFEIPEPYNEPIWDYAPGSTGRKALQDKYQEMKNTPVEIPILIGGEEYKTGNLGECRPPHNHQHLLGTYHKASAKEMEIAINTALAARKKWSATPLVHRAAIFLRAAELISTKYRSLMNAATMLAQSKTCHQSEIDAICELVDFLRFNVKFAEKIAKEQPISSKAVWNWTEYRPLEGFVYAITPFNFTAIGGNLPTSPAIMGNVVVWKPASSVVYSSYFFMKILKEAGLPDGVINMVPGDGSSIGNIPMQHRDFSGVHFTGSTPVFQKMWKTIGENIEKYRSYPRIVGETGGKDFIYVHESANIDELVTAMTRGSFEYQGQKCSASSRCYMPDSIWGEVKEKLLGQVKTIKVGDVSDFSNFMGAVIDKSAFASITEYIEKVKSDANSEILIGGNYDDTKGYFIEPTVVLTSNPHSLTMEEEIFGPVLTIYVYPADKYEETMDVCDKTSIYALTGGVFAQDTHAIELAYEKLRDAAGNFYINDKVTGAVVGQQPFGGARASGTNDKAGSPQNLMRWTSVRSVKRSFASVTSYEYPFMQPE